MLAFLALIPFKDYVWGALVLALIGFGVYERQHLIDEGKQDVEVNITATTSKLEAKRAADLAAQHTADMAQLKIIEDSYANSLQISNAATDSLNGRLRDYEAASRRGLAVPGTPAAPAGPDAPATKPDSVTEALAGVTSAAAHDAAQVTALQAYVAKECR